MTKGGFFRKRPIAAAIGALGAPAVFISPAALGAEARLTEEVLVTATRRAATVQDVPINISAVTGDVIIEQGLTNLSDIAAWVPGLHVIDQGARGASRIVVRGLSVDPLAASEALGNSGGETVSTYVSEVPLYVDLKLNDLERVEVLLGPQGTLYGAGTLGGAIRYIPKKPELETRSLGLRGSAFAYSESEDAGYDLGATANLPLADNLALRASIDRLDDPGFIDYDFLVREVGVSDPDPDFSDPADVAANLRSVEDANDEEVTSGRVALRWLPADAIDATLTYWFQFSEVGARTISSDDVLASGDYVSGLRVLEPNDRDNELVSLELIADLGFAELTSATGFSRYDEQGQRDQTDLLITLEYSYEAFPSFTSFTREDQEDETLTQEMRLVSTSTGPLSWIVGGFYNKKETDVSSKELTPGFDQFAVDNFGGVALRPDSLEYFNVDREDLEETAVYGELSYQLTDAWQVTVGARWYKYELETEEATDFPLFSTVFDGRAPDSIVLDFAEGGQDDDGMLFKLNTSYRFSDDVLAYATVSEGYRIGGSNDVPPCPDPLPPQQIVCALPNEQEFSPDETLNYEAGIHSTWLDGQLTLNGAVYYIDWTDPQLLSATENGLQPISKNGEGAESTGFEVSMSWLIDEHWSVRGSYGYSKAELNDTTTNLIETYNPPGFQSTISYIDGEDGDRLPGSPEHQGSLFVAYETPFMGGYLLELNYGIAGNSDVYTRVDKKGFGEALDGYVLHNASVVLRTDTWSATLFAHNLTDEFVESGARLTRAAAQLAQDINGEPVVVRRYYKDVLPPRMIGLRLSWDMEN